MRCDEVQKRLVEFMEGELGAEEQAGIQAHLNKCGACAAELKAFEHTMTLLEDDGYEEPSPFYWTRFEAGLRARLRERSGRFVLVPRLKDLAPRLAPIAVAVLFFCAGLGFGLQPILNLAGTSDSSGTYAESVDYRGPVVSPRAKSLVESGLEREMAQYAVNAADTLTPESFDSAVEQPRMMLATDESWPGVQPGMGERPTVE
ncbi:MAG: zf-HC2 domain-containing protein [Candidatus Eisenbacteria bacterium]|nr:zf-HC2 domain-containing protein [Candidatus Eisenbacteria bacterium]